MKHKELLYLIIQHCIFFIIATTMFIVLFYTPLFERSVLFYRGIQLLALDSFIATIFLIYLRKRFIFNRFTIKDGILALVIFVSFNLNFFILVPVSADRSLTVFLLGYMKNHPNEIITQEKMTDRFFNVYFGDHQALNKRFDEQLVSGNIKQDGEEYKLTLQGKEVIQFYTSVSDFFKIDKKNISP